MGHRLSSLQNNRQCRPVLGGRVGGPAFPLKTQKDRVGKCSTPTGKCQWGRVLLENLEMSGPRRPVSKRPGLYGDGMCPGLC